MDAIMQIINKNYPIKVSRLELLRDAGSIAYTVFSHEEKYFLRVIKPAFFDTAIKGAEIQLFLKNQDYSVPRIIFTHNGLSHVNNEDTLLILYEFIQGTDSDPIQDAEPIGALVGKLHQIMKEYPSGLVKRDKQFYIGRYIDILRIKEYPKINEYITYGNGLWEAIKGLPTGYSHGDMYSGNIRKASDDMLYIHDFDTSCEGFPMYDIALICNMTEYFNFDERNYDRSNKVFLRFLSEYGKYNSITEEEAAAFHALIAVQHFSTQATIMEIFGHDCIDYKVMDNQLDWLYRWRRQCKGKW